MYWGKYGGEQADPHLLVKFAVRYKGAGEAILVQAYPAADVPVTELLETEALAVAEQDLREEAPAGVGHAEVPADLAAAGSRGIEKVLKERLPDKLAAKVWVDPVTKGSSLPGEDREAFAARLQQAGGGAQEARLREKLEKKQRELQARTEDLQGRKTEKWAAVGSAILSNVGLILGKKRTISGAGTVSKNRMENTAESRVEALQAEVAALQEELQAMAQVDPARFQETTVIPARGGVKVLRYALLWVYWVAAARLLIAPPFAARLARKATGGMMVQANGTVASALNTSTRTSTTSSAPWSSLSRIPSISAEGFPRGRGPTLRGSHGGRRCARPGWRTSQVLEIPGVHPYVYGDWLHRPGAPTILLYGHHDVQPPGAPRSGRRRPSSPPSAAAASTAAAPPTTRAGAWPTSPPWPRT